MLWGRIFEGVIAGGSGLVGGQGDWVLVGVGVAGSRPMGLVAGRLVRGCVGWFGGAEPHPTGFFQRVWGRWPGWLGWDGSVRGIAGCRLPRSGLRRRCGTVDGRL